MGLDEFGEEELLEEAVVVKILLLVGVSLDDSESVLVVLIEVVKVKRVLGWDLGGFRFFREEVMGLRDRDRREAIVEVM